MNPLAIVPHTLPGRPEVVVVVVLEPVEATDLGRPFGGMGGRSG